MDKTTQTRRINDALIRLDTCQDALKAKDAELLRAVTLASDDVDGLRDETETLEAAVMSALHDLEAAFRDDGSPPTPPCAGTSRPAR